MQRTRVSLILIVLCTLVVGASSVGASPHPGAAQRPLADFLGGGFTYQGQLKRSGSPVSGACDFQFTLWDAATSGNQIGPLVSRLSLPVSGGVFTAEDLNFGAAAFDGDARWLEISVMCAGDSDFVVLSPRQGIAAAPYALYAPEAGNAAGAPWGGLTDVPAGFADDVDDEGSGTVTSVDTGAGLTGGPITTSGTISLADGGVTTSHIADGTILAEDLADGASLAEILDNDGHSSGLDADLIDSHHYSELATATHTHSALDAADGSPTNAIVVTADGRTGIGTTTPGVTLEIGSLATGESKPTVFVAGSIIDRTFTGGTPDAPAFATYNYPAHSTRYGIGQVLGGLGLIAFEGPGVGNYGNIQFFTGNLSSGFPSAERMRIGYNGYVGIGTTSPGQMLDVVGNVRTNGQFTSTVVTGTAPLTVASTTLVTNLNADLLDGQSAAYYQRAVGGSCSVGSSIRAIGADGSVTCETDDAGTGTVTLVDTGSGLSGGPISTTGTISIATGGVTSTHILDNTISPSDIADGATLNEISDDDGAGSGLDADLLDGLEGSAYAPASHAHSALNASDGSPTDSVYVDSAGHVGVGTTSPGADTLSVVGPVRVNGLLTLPYVLNTNLNGLAPGAYVDIPIETVTGLAFYMATTYNSYFSTNPKLRAWVWTEALNDAGPSWNQNKYWVRVENIGTETCTAYDSVLVIKMAGFTP